VKRFAPPERVTIADVAERAAVSKTTVSHVLSGKRTVAATTRTRVKSAIQELGYRPDGLARSLRTQRTHMIALMIPDIANPYYPPLARGLEDGVGPGYRTFICNTDGHTLRERGFLEEVTDRRADGIVLDSYGITSDVIGEVVSPTTSVVRLGTTVTHDPGYDTVHADDEHGAFEAVSYLISGGHRRIAMIQGPPGAGGERNNGYLRALQEVGVSLDPELVVSGDWTRAGGAIAARELLTRNDPPTAIFCANDLIALGTMDTARELRIDVPNQLALMGFDNIEAAAMLSPPLTTVSNLAYETGLIAGILLRERLTGSYQDTPRTVTLPCSLVRRGSA
jgi:LacI family transcriptional regulator, galactose operon repressor